MIQPRRNPESTDEQYSHLLAQRDFQRRAWTQSGSEAWEVFDVLCQIHKSQLLQYWSESDASEFMEWLIDYSWCFLAPSSIIHEWAPKALDAAKQGGTIDELRDAGIFDTVYPISFFDNADPLFLASREAQITNEVLAGKRRLPFREQIKATMKGTKFPPGNSN